MLTGCTRLLAFLPFTATGALATLLLPETRGKSLEELSGEEQGDFVHGKFSLSIGYGTILRC